MDENNQPIDYHKTKMETLVVLDECMLYVYGSLLDIVGPSNNITEWEEEKKLFKESGDANLELVAELYEAMTEASAQIWEDDDVDQDEYDEIMDKRIGGDAPPPEESTDGEKEVRPPELAHPDYRTNVAITALIIFENIELLFEQLVQLAFAGFMSDLPLEDEYFYEFSIFEDSGDPIVDIILDIVKQTRDTFISLLNLNALTQEELLFVQPWFGRLDSERLERFFEEGHL
jgi:hypothetical protein